MIDNWPTWTDDLPMWLSGVILAYLGLRLLRRSLFHDRYRGRPRCPKCWYDMTGIESLRCPECGTTVKRDARLLKTRRRWRWSFAAIIILLGGVAIILTPKIRRDGIASITPTTALILFCPTDDNGDVSRELFTRIGNRAARDGDVVLWDWQWALLRRRVVESFESDLGRINRFRALDRLKNWRQLGTDDSTIRDGLLDLVNTNGSPSVRQQALERLSWWRLLSPDDVDRLAAWLVDRDSGIRLTAVGVFGSQRVKSALNADACVNALFEIVAEHNRRISGAAMRALALAHRHYDRVIPMLNDELENKFDYVRSNACSALATIGTHDLIDTARIVDRLEDTSSGVRSSAIEAIAKCTAPEFSIPHLTRKLEDPDSYVRRRVLYSLRSMNSSAVATTPAIVHILLNDPSASVRATAARTLWRVGADPAVAVPALVWALVNDENYVRIDAVWTLGQYGEAAQDAIPALELAQNDDSQHVRKSATDALFQIRSTK